MLARASSDAGTRLRRSKSTSTVHRHPPPIIEPLDPDLARQQAVAAATAAFVRAQSHDAVDRTTKRSSEVTRSKSNASRKSLTMQGQGSHFPPRGSSFRSQQSQKPGHDTATVRPYRASTINSENFPPFYPMPSIDRPVSAPRPLSTQPSIAFSEHGRPNTQPKMSRQSASSSITSQQIRKARSMYYASSVQTGSPISRPPTMYLTTPPPTSVAPKPDLSVAIPPSRTLGPSPLAEPRIPVTVDIDESVDKARDKYLQSFQQHSVKHKPSLFMAPFMKRQDRGKDKGKRVHSGFASTSASSQRTPDDAIADIPLNDFMPQADKKDKRSFSGSLKSKIRRVFRRTSKTSPNLPVQQIEASREYFGTAPVDIESTVDLFAIPSPDENILQRVRARTPSYEPHRSLYVRSGSRSSSNGSARSKRSNQSLHSEVHATITSASRVTSWGTTSTQDTLAQQAIKRLTIIHESKDSIGSEADHAASLSTKRKPLPLGTLAAFRDPMPMESLMEESSTPVDPKRVFSALMKEITTSKSADPASNPLDRTPGAESDVFESSTTKILHSVGRDLHSSASRNFRANAGNDDRPPSRRAPSAAAQSTQSKTSSMRILGRAIRSTIRTVTPGEQRSSPCPVPPASVGGTTCIPGDSRDSSPVITTPDANEDCINIDTSKPYHTPAPEVFSPSREQIERRVSKAKERWKTPLDDVAQLQFPRETERTYNVASFARHIVPGQDPHRSLEQMEKHRTDVPEAPCSPPPRAVMSPLSPSVYSRNTDGMSILPNDSVMSLQAQDQAEQHHIEGSAVILTSQSIRSYVVGTPSPRRPDSACSSRDWKAWLSHEVSSMEFTSQEDLKIDEQYLTPSGKHRGNATRTSHTEQDDTTVILRPSCDTITPQVDQATPTTTVAQTHETTNVSTPTTNSSVSAPILTPVLEKSQLQTNKFKEVSPANTPPNNEQVQKNMLKRPGSIPLLSKQHPSLTPSHASFTSQPLVETPRSSMMNDRFPFINTGRRSSSNSARSSRASRSPPDSIASSLKSAKATPGITVYSDLSAPATQQTSQRVRNSAPGRNESPYASKENLTPPSIDGNKRSSRPKISPLGLTSRTKSLQPLSLMALNRSTTNIGQHTSNTSELKHSNHIPSPTASPARPRVRAIVRPTSPEKLTRRPKSAFDLRGTRTLLPRPASELRRPALHLKTSTDSLALSREPSPGQEGRAIDSILEEGERSGSITPGQRMADRFLRERKSTGVLENGRVRGGLRLVREDTPAFL